LALILYEYKSLGTSPQKDGCKTFTLTGSSRVLCNLQVSNASDIYYSRERNSLNKLNATRIMIFFAWNNF